MDLYYASVHSCSQIPPLTSGRSTDFFHFYVKCLPFFFQQSGSWFTFQWSLRFHFPDFFFSSSPQKNAVLCLLAHTGCSHEQFKYLELCFLICFFRALSLTKIYWKPSIRFISFPGFPDYQDATYQLIIFSVGQWTTSLPQYTSFLSFGFFGSLLLRVLLLGRVYHFVTMP